MDYRQHADTVIADTLSHLTVTCGRLMPLYIEAEKLCVAIEKMRGDTPKTTQTETSRAFVALIKQAEDIVGTHTIYFDQDDPTEEEWDYPDLIRPFHDLATRVHTKQERMKRLANSARRKQAERDRLARDLARLTPQERAAIIQAAQKP